VLDRRGREGSQVKREKAEAKGITRKSAAPGRLGLDVHIHQKVRKGQTSGGGKVEPEKRRSSREM